jgi:AraC-like DNA-binding protein
LNSYRLAEAASRLVNSDAPITTIAIEVGFSSLSVFNTAFRGRFGVTPTGYRVGGTNNPVCQEMD